MLKTLKSYGKMYKCPFIVQYDEENIRFPYRVECYGNGHYFLTEREAFAYAENEISEYYRTNPRRKRLY